MSNMIHATVQIAEKPRQQQQQRAEKRAAEKKRRNSQFKPSNNIHAWYK